MENYKQEFIEFMVESDVLKFGDFTLKSGRKSPFFMNAGAYVTGSQLHRLGQYYAKAIHDNYGTDFDVLFGPAYKGIPLAVATVIAFSELYGKEIRYCANRKSALDEIKELYGFDAKAIVTMEEVVEYLYNRPCQGKVRIDDAMKAAIDAYYVEYGAK